MSVTDSPLLVAGVAVVIGLAFVAPLVLARALAVAVDGVAEASAAGLGSAAADRVVAALTIVGVVFAIGQATAPVVDSASDVVGLRVRAVVFRRTIVALLRPASVGHLEDPATADIVEQATAPTQYGPRSAVRGLASQWVMRASGAGSLVVVAGYRWWMGGLLFAAIVHLGVRTRHRIIDIATAQHFQTRQLRRSDYLRELLVAPAAAKEIRVFGFGSWLVGRFEAEWRAAMQLVWDRRRRLLSDELVGVAPVAAVVAFIGWAAAHDAVDGAISVGVAAAVLSAVLAAPSLATVSAWDNWLELGLGSIRALLELESAMEERVKDMDGGRNAADLPRREIRFERVGFSYPGQRHQVFRELDLALEVGKSLAIVGDNGAGKTTLVKLLTRLYDPTSGRILVDGTDLRDLDAKSWQRRTAAIFQDFCRIAGTAHDNVTFFADIDDAEDAMGRAALAAGAEEVIDALPNGWHTMLSRQFGGTDLSGGQWQRIALARALFAAERGAPILVLDEPTAHLDVRQEASFYDRFFEVTSGRTAIVISHRFSTVRRAERIVVLEHGRVVEDGSHDELVSRGGRYAQMYNLQASRFSVESADE